MCFYMYTKFLIELDNSLIKKNKKKLLSIEYSIKTQNNFHKVDLI